MAQRRESSRLSPRAQRDEAMKPEVQRVFDANFKVYGAWKVWRQMQREGARCTVERLMRDLGLQGVIRGKPVKTTISDKAAPCPLDQVNRQFHAPAPNMLWVSDFTYVATWAGFVYVAFVIDVYARYIVGWRVSRTAHASFVLDALEQAIHDRPPVHRGGLIHHSDRGSQYASIKHTERLAEAGIEPSVGSVGDSSTTPWLRRSTTFTRPRSSIGEARGAHSKPWNTPRSNGWTGSTTAGCSNPSAISRPPRPKSATTPCWTRRQWLHNLIKLASGNPGAVQSFKATLSSIVSAISRLSFAFSLSSSHKRQASDTPSPPYLAFPLQIVTSDTPCRRARSAVFTPAYASFSTPMICSSVNLLRFFVCPSFRPDSNRSWRKIRGSRQNRCCAKQSCGRQVPKKRRCARLR